jgi:hypothetical protein
VNPGGLARDRTRLRFALSLRDPFSLPQNISRSWQEHQGGAGLILGRSLSLASSKDSWMTMTPQAMSHSRIRERQPSRQCASGGQLTPERAGLLAVWTRAPSLLKEDVAAALRGRLSLLAC